MSAEEDLPSEELQRRLAERRRMDAQAFPTSAVNALMITWLALQFLAFVVLLGAWGLRRSGLLG